MLARIEAERREAILIIIGGPIALLLAAFAVAWIMDGLRAKSK